MRGEDPGGSGAQNPERLGGGLSLGPGLAVHPHKWKSSGGF